MHFENFPIHAAHFTVDGNEVIVGSNKFGHFFSYDMIYGKIVRVPWDKGKLEFYLNILQFHLICMYIIVNINYACVNNRKDQVYKSE